MVIAMVEVMVTAMEVKVTAMGVMAIHMRNIPMAIIQIWKVCSSLSEPVFWVSDQVQHILSKKQASSLTFWIQVHVVGELYYLCRENQGADKLCSYCTADLLLFFT